MFDFYISTLSKILSLLQAVASKPWNIHLMCNAPKDYHLYSVFWFLEAFLITSSGNINLFSWIIYHIFLDSKFRDISSTLPKAIVIFSSNLESDLGIPDSYKFYIGTATQVQLLNDEPDWPIRIIITNDTEVIVRKVLLKQFPKSVISKRIQPLSMWNAVF